MTSPEQGPRGAQRDIRGRPPQWLQWLVSGIVACTLWVFWSSQLTGARVDSDAGNTLAMAVNLVHDGIMDHDIGEPLEPSMYREPIPVATAAIMVMILDALHGRADAKEYFSGERAQFIKLENLLWLSLLCIATFVAARVFGLSFWWALACAVLAQLLYFIYPGMSVIGIDTLYSEIPATGMLVLASSIATVAFRDRSWRIAALAGLVFGVLALIKAAALYVFVGFIFVIGFFAALSRSGNYRTWSRFLAALVGSFVLVTVPWMIRNHALFGRFEISERGGLALFTRALKNEMNSTEYRGSFYVWSMRPIRPWVGKILGFSEQDLQRGGSLQRLNRDASDFLDDDWRAARAGKPEETISFYMRGRAERTRAQIKFEEAGVSNSGGAADRVLAEKGLEMIRAKLGRHIAVTIPLLWRGAPLSLPIIAAALLLAFWRRRFDLAIFVTASLGYVVAHALFTPFEVRYGTIVYPVAIVALFVMLNRSTPLYATAPGSQPALATSSESPSRV